MTKIAYAHDGTSVYDKLFLNSLKNLYEVYILTFHSSPSQVPPGVKTVRMADAIPETNLHPFEGMRKHFLTPLRARTLKKTLARIRPDVLIGCWASTYGFYSACTSFHPFILFIWGSDVLIYPKKYFPLKPFVVYSLRKADLVVVDSEVQKEAATELGCSPEKIVKFPWVDLTRFQKNESKRRIIRNQCGWKEDDIVVVSLRNHKPIYGVEYLIDSIPHVVRENSNIKFLILGEGPLSIIFKTKVKNFIKSGHVKFVGTVPHEKISDYLSAADIYVSTSFSDGTSASLLEASACSLAPIVTEIKGNKEWIQEGVNGILVPLANTQSLVEKILLLANDPKLRENLQKKAEETVKAKVNWRENINKLSEIIDKMILQERAILNCK